MNLTKAQEAIEALTALPKIPSLLRLHSTTLREMLRDKRVTLYVSEPAEILWDSKADTLAGVPYIIDDTLEPGTWRFE